jgi:uncharacterized small protein (TIGR04563 family)
MADENGQGDQASDKSALALGFPKPMLSEMQDEAVRQDRSLSWIARTAWVSARMLILSFGSADEMEKATAEPAYQGIEAENQSLFYPDPMIEEISTEAERLGASKERIMQAAWVLARSEIAALPSAD